MKGRNNTFVAEYTVDYRSGDVCDIRAEGEYKASDAVSRDEYINLEPKYNPYCGREIYSVRPQKVVKEIGVSKSRVVLASVLLVLVIASVAAVVTLANPNFAVDMNFLGNL